MREQGPKGAVLVEVEHQRVTLLEHRALDVVRFCRVPVDVAAEADLEGVLERIERGLEAAAIQAEGRLIAARVVLTGASAAHAALVRDPEHLLAEVRSLASGLASDAWIERVDLETLPQFRRGELRSRTDLLGELLRELDRLHAEDAAVDELKGALGELKQKLPSELWLAEDGVAFDDVKELRQTLREVEALVLPRILLEEGG
jgi:hypothetical protein